MPKSRDHRAPSPARLFFHPSCPWGCFGFVSAPFPPKTAGPSSPREAYLKQRTDLVLFQVSLDSGLLTRRHGETDWGGGEKTERPCASEGDNPPLPRTGAGTGAPEPRLRAASSWGAESRKPRRGACESHNSRARGELIHRVHRLRPPARLSAAPARRETGGRGSALLRSPAAGMGGRGAPRCRCCCAPSRAGGRTRVDCAGARVRATKGAPLSPRLGCKDPWPRPGAAIARPAAP
jgi:hypothetical protein